MFPCGPSCRSFLLTLVTAAPAAEAATATLTLKASGYNDRSSPVTFAEVDVAAAAGEANRLVISSTPGAIEVRDSGTTLVAGSGCAEGSGGSVRCEIPDRAVPFLSVDAGDGDDEVDASAVAAAGFSADGGPGADRLVGTRTHDTIKGGEGDDRLLGMDDGTTSSAARGATRWRVARAPTSSSPTTTAPTSRPTSSTAGRTRIS